MRGTVGMLVGLAVGMAAGLLLPPEAARAVEPIGLLWFNGLRMTVVPIVMAQLILGLNTQLQARALGALGMRAMAWFTGLYLAAAVFSLVVMLLCLPGMPGKAPEAAGMAPGPVPGFGDWVASLLPSNVLQAAVEGRFLALILFAILFGAAVRTVEAERRQALLSVVGAVNDAMLTIVGWLLRLAPIGVGALAVPLLAQRGGAVAGAFGYYIIVFCGIEVAITLAMYPLVLALGTVKLRDFVTAVLPVQALGFGSRSSLAALPAMVAVAEQRLGLGPALTGFVLPLAVSMFRFSTPVSHVTGALFIGHLFGVELTALQMLIMVVTTVLLSYSSPGIPSGGLLVALPLFHQLGLPPEGLGLLVAADAIPDMFKTSANVTAHMAVASILRTD